MPRKNKELNKIYDSIFKKGEGGHFTKLIDQKGLPEDEREAIKELKWQGKKVLEIGCGTGLFAYEVAKRGAMVTGIDYSLEAIQIAQKTHIHPNLTYVYKDVKNLKNGKYDVVVSLGTLEHLDDPLVLLKRLKKHLQSKGSLILTCPNWTNPRGYMLMTLFHLFDAPITLADIHYFSPKTFEAWAAKLGMTLSWRTFNRSRATGKALIVDFKKRLPNVLRDAKLPNKKKNINNLLTWIEEQVIPFPDTRRHSGATALYHLRKK